MTTFAVIPQAYAVSNAAGTSHAVRDTTKNPADGNEDCTTTKQCILMSSDGAAGNDNHGVFLKNGISGACYSPFFGSNGGQFVEIDSAMASTAISSLTFITSGGSTLCTTANTWHIFKTTTGNTIWAVKLDGSANMPTTLDSSNLINCDPAGTFNTTTGCTPLAAPPVSAPIFNLNQPAVIYSEEINVTK